MSNTAIRGSPPIIASAWPPFAEADRSRSVPYLRSKSGLLELVGVQDLPCEGPGRLLGEIEQRRPQHFGRARLVGAGLRRFGSSRERRLTQHHPGLRQLTAIPWGSSSAAMKYERCARQ
jgi:hypothetical protein